MEAFAKYISAIERTDPIKYVGRVTKVLGILIESHGPQAVIGEVCQIVAPRLGRTAYAEVVGLREDAVQLMCYEGLEGIEVGCPVIATGQLLEVPVSNRLLGRVLDCMGRPADGKGDISSEVFYPAVNKAPDALTRKRITRRVVTGVRAIDGMIPMGRGQRIGIFAGSGVGKSTLLGMIARNTDADINVIALIGERGREVREFIENDLGPEGLARSVLIVSTSDTPPLARLRGAYVAAAVSEYFRDQGKDVMLLFDSVTRFARAQREIGLATGEPPATRGYTPSVFDAMPKLLERSGTSDKGSITGIYTILVDGDDMDEPVADTVRGILDGHIVLSRRLAQKLPLPGDRCPQVGIAPHGIRHRSGDPQGHGLCPEDDGGLRGKRGHDHDRSLCEGLEQGRRRGHFQARPHRGIPHAGRRRSGAHQGDPGEARRDSGHTDPGRGACGGRLRW